MPNLLDPEFLFKEETYSIIGAAMEVHKHLGCGFLEAVYQEALEIEFKDREVPHNKEAALNIIYKDQLLRKQYFTDFICYNEVIVEIKALSEITSEHEAQLLNYLKATNKKVGLLINFGKPSLQYKRIATSNFFK